MERTLLLTTDLYWFQVEDEDDIESGDQADEDEDGDEEEQD